LDGKYLAAISRAEKILKIWHPPHGFIGLFSHTLQASKDVVLSGDEPNSGKQISYLLV
jgi:hypothetical protein